MVQGGPGKPRKPMVSDAASVKTRRPNNKHTPLVPQFTRQQAGPSKRPVLYHTYRRKTMRFVAQRTLTGDRLSMMVFRLLKRRALTASSCCSCRRTRSASSASNPMTASRRGKGIMPRDRRVAAAAAAVAAPSPSSSLAAAAAPVCTSSATPLPLPLPLPPRPLPMARISCARRKSSRQSWWKREGWRG